MTSTTSTASASVFERVSQARETMANANVLLTIFYALVALVAVTGQTLGATEYLGWEWQLAVLPAALLELGGIALAVFADARRRLGERAVAARVGAVTVAVFATWFNWISHSNRIAALLFAGFTAFGFALWLITSEARRRDALRANGMLPEPAPAYPLAQWAARPWLTWHARTLAKADPALGLYGSLDVAGKDLDRQQRNRRLARALRRRIRAERGRAQAALAVRIYDMDAIAERLRATADVEGLAQMLGEDFTPASLMAPEAAPKPERLQVEGVAPRRRAPSKQPRRTPEETLALAADIKAKHPGITDKDLAAKMRITIKRLRDVLNGAAGQQMQRHEQAAPSWGEPV